MLEMGHSPSSFTQEKAMWLGKPREPQSPRCPTAHRRLFQRLLGCTQTGEGRTQGYRHTIPTPWLPLPITHSALHAAPLERKYKNLSPWDWPAMALQRPFHSPSTDTGAAPDVFVSPLLPLRESSEPAASPALGSQGQAGARDPAAILGAGLGMGVASQLQREARGDKSWERRGRVNAYTEG